MHLSSEDRWSFWLFAGGSLCFLCDLCPCFFPQKYLIIVFCVLHCSSHQLSHMVGTHREAWTQIWKHSLWIVYRCGHSIGDRQSTVHEKYSIHVPYVLPLKPQSYFFSRKTHMFLFQQISWTRCLLLFSSCPALQTRSFPSCYVCWSTPASEFCPWSEPSVDLSDSGCCWCRTSCFDYFHNFKHKSRLYSWFSQTVSDT